MSNVFEKNNNSNDIRPDSFNMKTLAIMLILIMVALLSFSKITSYTTNIETHRHTIEQLDQRAVTVMELTASITAISAAVSMLPDDTCTPIANQLASYTKYFLIVLVAIYAEKYLVTVMGFFSFKFLIPIACILLAIFLFAKKQWMKKLAIKLIICAIAFYIIIPVSVRISDFVYENYNSSIVETIDDANQLAKESDEAGGVENLVEWIKNKAGNTLDYVENSLSKCINSLAVLLVTSCVIPILVIVFFVVFFKLVFGVKTNL